MKQIQQQNPLEEELGMLVDQLSREELFILGFLKGFNRSVEKEWERKQLWDFSS